MQLGATPARGSNRDSRGSHDGHRGSGLGDAAEESGHRGFTAGELAASLVAARSHKEKDNMRRLVSRLLPSALKQKIRQSHYYTHRTAVGLASSSKRIDVCSAQFAHVLHLSKHPPIEGKTCLEIGAGWVLTHALVCYLLGARRVIATDIVACAQPDTISFALRDAVASIPRDILAPFSDYSRIRERFDRLTSISRFSFETLRELGIEYRSPVDFAAEKVNTPVDFIYSQSVLEHVPTEDVPALLSNLAESLNQGGSMIHCIHLEDHRDSSRHPFDFLSVPGERYTRELQSARGNRIRCSEWRRLFGNLEGMKTELLFGYSRPEMPLPESIDPSVPHHDDHDLRTSHIGVYARKAE